LTFFSASFFLFPLPAFIQHQLANIELGRVSMTLSVPDTLRQPNLCLSSALASNSLLAVRSNTSRSDPALITPEKVANIMQSWRKNLKTLKTICKLRNSYIGFAHYENIIYIAIAVSSVTTYIYSSEVKQVGCFWEFQTQA